MTSRIEDYAVVSDMQSAALAGLDGSIDWLCFPRFDSAACFAALLGNEENGYWRVAPVSGGPATRRGYRGDSLILQSEWDTPDGTVRVIDFMPRRQEAPHLVRIVEGVTGEVPVSSEMRLRFDYGRIIPWVRHVDDMVVAVTGPDSVWLDGDVEHRAWDFAAYAEFTVRAGERVRFVLAWNPSHRDRPTPVDAVVALQETEHFWNSWTSRCTYRGPYREAVVRSLITLKGLTYAPTGGIVAAATTSLPEEVGGERNWDYRFCWLRDAAFTLQVLLRTGYVDEAWDWTQWLVRAVAGSPEHLQIMYGVAGERRLPEVQLPWLDGYAGSRPVRVGNGAADQLQLDVFGEVMDTLWLARCYGLTLPADTWRMQLNMMDWLELTWREPDEGVWEVRGPRQLFTHSKILCWVAADRAVKSIERWGLRGPVDRYRAMRDEIHREICAKGYDRTRNTFTQFYGSRQLDAALLLIPQVGFLPGTDPRVIGTVDAIRRELAFDGFVRRYDTAAGRHGPASDGLSGEEATFLACSFWLADALIWTGRRAEGEQLFRRLLALRNDLGLLAEEYDPLSQRQLGNVPQAYSHLGLVHTALMLLEREEQMADVATGQEPATP